MIKITKEMREFAKSDPRPEQIYQTPSELLKMKDGNKALSLAMDSLFYSEWIIKTLTKFGGEVFPQSKRLYADRHYSIWSEGVSFQTPIHSKINRIVGGHIGKMKRIKAMMVNLETNIDYEALKRTLA